MSAVGESSTRKKGKEEEKQEHKEEDGKVMDGMVDRKWEEVPFDCLVGIFVRVGLASLVEAVSLVCKSWYKTSLSPLCYQSLLFPDVIPLTKQERCSATSLPTRLGVPLTKQERCSATSLPMWLGVSPKGHSHEEFVKFVIGRSKGSANVVGFLSRSYMTQEVFDCIGDRCPSLKKLMLPSIDSFCASDIVLSSLICKWKDLEALRIGRGFPLEEIIQEISTHCKNFVSLTAVNVGIRQSEASAIANLLPNIKFLSLRNLWIQRSDLLTIMKGCQNLELLYVRFCIGFDVDDEILNLAAHIANVDFEGSKLKYYDDSYDEDDYALSSRDVDFGGDSD